MEKKITKILIANRGEIACRVIRTAKKMGIQSVAVYSDCDSTAQHVLQADEAYHLGGNAAKDSYLNQDKIIAIAKLAQVDAIHPGYGFLSENASFAQRLVNENIIFIGPSVAAITKMGSKAEAKRIMHNANVPLVPGYHAEQQDLKTLTRAANEIGYPVLIKAASGGGGKGMRIVRHEKELADAINSAKREAQSSFADDQLILEKYLENPRHIEMQILADQHGNILHLFERDCSIQRRYQKVIEEAPAFGLTDKLRQNIATAAVNAAAAINYTGAGTIEFLLDQNHAFYFMEMNTRLQVEHPVTEMITGLDLVEWQINVAKGQKFPFTQADIKNHGTAIEARIYAEDPDNHFLPSIGKITQLIEPKQTSHCRIDSGIVSGDEISMYYDPMIAKLIIWDENRDLAVKRLQQVLINYAVIGVKSNLAFLRKIAQHPDFANQQITTHFIEKNQKNLMQKPILTQETLALAALAELLPHNKECPTSPWHLKNAWQMNLPATRLLRFLQHEQLIQITASLKYDHIKLTSDNIKLTVSGQWLDHHTLHASIADHSITARIYRAGDEIVIITPGQQQRITHYNPQVVLDKDSEDHGLLISPMPGTVIAVMAKAGQKVNAGDQLMIMEAMKMEHTITAPQAGVIKSILFNVGDQVAEGIELLKIEQI